MNRLILQNANYFDSVNGKLVEGQTIVSTGRIISWIGDTNSFEKEDEDKVIDVSGKAVIPGLMDCHVHLGMNASPDYVTEQVRTNSETYPFYGLKHAQNHLKSGFTTLREVGNMGGNSRWGLSLKQLFAQHYFYGPRMLYASAFIGQKGNQALMGPDELIYTKSYDEAMVSGVEEVIAAVRVRKENGADVIKTATTGGVLHGQESNIERSLWRTEELEALTDEAHRLGLHCAAHAHGPAGILKAVETGFDTVEHATYVTEDIADLMVQKGTYIVPTHNAVMGLKVPETYQKMPPEVQKKIDATAENMFNNHKVAYEKGVKFALGTDCGTPSNYHGTTAEEISSMVNRVGMTNVQALQCATIESAKAIKLSEITGSIEVGKMADIVVVNGNPLDNVTVLENTSNLDYVIRDGVVMAKNGKLVSK